MWHIQIIETEMKIMKEQRPARFDDLERNRIINRAHTDLDSIVNNHDPEIDHISNKIWDRLDKMSLEIECHRFNSLDGELKDLQKINQSLSDYLLAKKIPEFADEHGGLEEIYGKMVELHLEYEKVFNTLYD